MKKAFSIFSALLSLCLLVTPAFAADDSPEVFSFEVVIQEERPSGPVPNRRNEYPSAFSAEEPDESPNIPESPESPALPAPDEDERPSWISGYIRSPGGFEYPKLMPKPLPTKSSVLPTRSASKPVCRRWSAGKMSRRSLRSAPRSFRSFSPTPGLTARGI